MFSPGTQENNDWAEERKDWAEEKEKDLKIAQLQQHLEAQAIQLRELAAANEVLRKEKREMADHLEQANRKFRGSMELAKAKMQDSSSDNVGSKNSPQPQHNKLKKDAIGAPMNFKHVEHAGAGEALKFDNMPEVGVKVIKKGEENSSSVRQAVLRGQRPTIGPPTEFTQIEHIGSKAGIKIEELPDAGPHLMLRGSSVGASEGTSQSPVSRSKNGKPQSKRDQITKLDIGPPTSFEHVGSLSSSIENMMQFQSS